MSSEPVFVPPQNRYLLSRITCLTFRSSVKTSGLEVHNGNLLYYTKLVPCYTCWTFSFWFYWIKKSTLLDFDMMGELQVALKIITNCNAFYISGHFLKLTLNRHTTFCEKGRSKFTNIVLYNLQRLFYEMTFGIFPSWKGSMGILGSFLFCYIFFGCVPTLHIFLLITIQSFIPSVLGPLHSSSVPHFHF